MHISTDTDVDNSVATSSIFNGIKRIEGDNKKEHVENKDH